MGGIGYECMTSKRPYRGKGKDSSNKNKIRDAMMEE